MEDVYDDLWIFNIETSIWEMAQRIPENITWPEVDLFSYRKGKELH
jgi:hypothetical protein